MLNLLLTNRHSFNKLFLTTMSNYFTLSYLIVITFFNMI
ncbi:unnamed protein product [Schistosoma mattheei]|uniref:Uncharacterized protein n=1 Tax=Schistosoma mattheei TaxID=31246 RepID=A0A3P8J7N7_9TREM|nr:unnamed protein product [Schistosoma mattheei]